MPCAFLICPKAPAWDDSDAKLTSLSNDTRENLGNEQCERRELRTVSIEHCEHNDAT